MAVSQNYEELYSEQELSRLCDEYCKPVEEGRTKEHIKHFRPLDEYNHLPNTATPNIEEELVVQLERGERSNPLDANFKGNWR